MNEQIAEVVGGLRLVDHHCHGVIDTDLARPEFEVLLTESDWDAPPGTTVFDSQVGFAVRRRCAPVLGLEPFASAEDYLARRTELGAARVNELLLGATGIGDFLVDTGFRPGEILTPDQLAHRAGGDRAFEVLRLEFLLESLAREQVPAGQLRTRFLAALDEGLRTAVGVKTIAAYRINLDFDPARPTDLEVDEAASRWLSEVAWNGAVRVTDPVLIRFVIWAAIDRAVPIQFHVGYGDAHVDLHRCNPVHLTALCRATVDSGASFMLLHCYPYHREAGYLAQVFPHVYCDVGLAVNYTGARSPAVIAESLELTPFHKALFSSDAFGLAELYHLGAQLFRDGLTRVLTTWQQDQDWPVAELARVATMIGRENAIRAYRLPGG